MMKRHVLILCVLMPLTLNANQPQTFQALFNLGIEHFKAHRYEQALVTLEQAAILEPTHPELYFNSALICLAQEQYDGAASYLVKALTVKKDYPKALKHLTQILNKITNPAKALEFIETVLLHTPDHYDTLLCKARSLKALNKTDDALKMYAQLQALQPANIVGLFDLAYLYTIQNNYDAAIPLYKQILALNPTIWDAAFNCAHTLRYKGLMQEALEYYHRVLPYNNGAHTYYGMAECYLALGDFQHGWPAFEHRWKREPNNRNFTEKLWDGSPLGNKTILLRAEYGQGDTLQFIRYAQLLKQQGAYIILEAQDTLISLLKGCPWIDKIIGIQHSFSTLPQFDVQIPLMSLPYYFKTTENSIPCTIPYIYPDPALVQQWHAYFEKDKNIKIGICWHGSPYYEQFKSALSKKSIQLSDFLPLAQIKEITLYSLQFMDGIDQTASCPLLHTFSDTFDITHGRFMDTAAVIQNLDLVISIDTSVAHLAGALGKPVWVLLPEVADWRWMLTRSDSPWYPTMRLFRNSSSTSWTNVMHTVTNALTEWITNAQNNNKSVRVVTEIQAGELIDKITILQIKMERIKDEQKLKNIHNELTSLLDTCNKFIPQSDKLLLLWNALKKVNEKLWITEDDIRDKEKQKIFDPEFIELSRAVYYTNDERCAIKRDINILVGSNFIEEKSYTNYKQEKTK